MSKIEEINGLAKVSILCSWNKPLEEVPEPDWDAITSKIVETVDDNIPYEYKGDLEVDADYDGFSLTFRVPVEGTVETWKSTNPREYPDEYETEWDTPDETKFRKDMEAVVNMLDARIISLEMSDPEDYL